jgi:hypothetical protein
MSKRETQTPRSLYLRQLWIRPCLSELPSSRILGKASNCAPLPRRGPAAPDFLADLKAKRGEMCPTTRRICRPPALKTLPHHSRAVRQSSQALAVGKQTRPLPSHDHADASIRYGRQSRPVSPAPLRTLKLAEPTSRPQPASPRPDKAGSSEVTSTKQELTPEPQSRIWPIVATRLGAQMALFAPTPCQARRQLQ